MKQQWTKMPNGRRIRLAPDAVEILLSSENDKETNGVRGLALQASSEPTMFNVLLTEIFQKWCR
jgi:hypothetical protein